MNLVRLIIIALAIWIAFRIWQNYRTTTKKRPPKPKAIPDMVACTICKMHVPENEALHKDGKFYCSQQHLDAEQ